MFDEKKNFGTHVNKFLAICDELASYGEDIEQKDKASKLIRSLPPSFSSLAMVTSMTEASFDKISDAVKAEIARRANPNNLQSSNRDRYAPQAYAAQTIQTLRGLGTFRYRGRNRGRGRWRGRARGYRWRGFRGRGGAYRGRSLFEDDLEEEAPLMPCFYCGQHGHFIRVCPRKQSDENSGRIFKPHKGSYRGRGRGFPSSGAYHRGGGRTQGRWQTDEDWAPQDQSMKRQGGSEIGPPSANHATFTPRHPFRFDDPQGGYHANNVVIRFRSTLAKIEERKHHRALIDSGASHKFCFEKSLFVKYEPIANETVAAAFGKTHILGKGLVWIPLIGGMQITAYHAPQFHSHILAVSDLAKHFDILFSDHFRGYAGCFLLRNGTREVLFETPCVDGLYAVELLSPSKRKLPSVGTVAKVYPQALELHAKTGHPSAQRYLQLSNILSSVPRFDSSTLQEIDCAPCLSGKTKRAPIQAVIPSVTRPIQEIHLGVSGPFVPTWNNETYAVHFLDAFTAKSDIHLLSTKSGLAPALMQYKASVENHFAASGYRVKDIRLDKARENFTSIVVSFCEKEGINLAPSPAYALESNGTAERLVQEHWTRARVLMFGCDLPKELWGEALAHANWLRNRLPSSRISGQLPILRWNPLVKIDFSDLPTFGPRGFSFIYRSKTVANKKMLPRSEPALFVGMESDIRLIRVYIPTRRTVKVVRRADFRVVKDNKIPGISTLLDGLARQTSIEAEQDESEEANAEAHLVHCLAALHQETTRLAMPQTAHDLNVPRSFAEACQYPEWAAAIDREYNALIRRGTWTYVQRTPEMNVIAFLWIFRIKLLEILGHEYMCKARCCARGDLQEENIEFHPHTLYAPVASHESIRRIVAFAASNDYILEGGDVANAYLYGKMDVPVYMEQPTDSSQRQARPGMVCRLEKSIYGLKQAGNIWGSMMHLTLIEWGFHTSNFDSRLYMLRQEDRFVIVAIVVDDMAFASNSRSLLEDLKNRLKATFDVSFFGALKSFIGWDIIRTPSGIKGHQATYIRTLLKHYGLAKANPVRTPLPTNADLGPAKQHEALLHPQGHYAYRAIVGALLWLAVSTRADLGKPAGALARQMHAPTVRHLTLSKRVLRYLVGTVELGIHYPRRASLRPSSLGAAVDADWGGDLETRRSTTGYIVCVNGSPILWKSKRQTVIALSSAESEYVALSACGKDVTWLRKLFWEVCHQTPWSVETSFAPTRILVDSTAAAAIPANWQASSRTKHISLKHQHVRELMDLHVIVLHHVPSLSQPADLLTKIMNAETLMRMLRLLNMDM